jgi:hypothetical protein
MENIPNDNMNQPEASGAQNSDLENKPEVFSDEQNLKLIANFVLALGIFVTGVLAFTRMFVTIPGEYSFEDKKVFDAGGMAITVFTLLSSLASWACLRVISNISESLKQLIGKE